MNLLTEEIGIFTWYGFIIPIRENFSLIKNAGFSSIMLWLGNEFSETNGDYRSLPELAERFGLKVENAHIPYYGCDKLWFSGCEGEELLAKYKDDIASAAKIGIDTLVIHPFEKLKPIGGDYSQFIARYDKLVEAAYKYNIKLAIENLADNITLADIMEHYKNISNVGLCFDTGHNNVCANGDFSLLRSYKDRLFALHIHDNDSNSDQHLLPFEGITKWKAFGEILAESSYKRSFTLESSYPSFYDAETGYGSFSEENITAEEYLQKAFSHAKKALDLVKIPFA